MSGPATMLELFAQLAADLEAALVRFSAGNDALRAAAGPLNGEHVTKENARELTRVLILLAGRADGIERYAMLALHGVIEARAIVGDPLTEEEIVAAGKAA